MDSATKQTLGKYLVERIGGTLVGNDGTQDSRLIDLAIDQPNEGVGKTQIYDHVKTYLAEAGFGEAHEGHFWKGDTQKIVLVTKHEDSSEARVTVRQLHS
ncbi:MAG: hypothetical protein WC796_04405 [Candidatus Pacearchaeota archaeon]|jgi:hypothetical protein